MLGDFERSVRYEDIVCSESVHSQKIDDRTRFQTQGRRIRIHPYI